MLPPDAVDLMTLARAAAFTGTRSGLSPAQAAALGELLDLAGCDVHHGGAVGADAACHAACVLRSLPVHVHPCDLESQRARHLEGATSTAPPEPPLERNRHMVSLADVLIACPAGESEEVRSGTWATIRHARRLGVPVILVYPSGAVRVEGR